MLKRLADVKRYVKVGMFIQIKNYGRRTTRVVKILEIRSNSLIIGEQISRDDYYMAVSDSRTRNTVREIPTLNGSEYYRWSILEWQLAKHTRVYNNRVEMLCYPHTLSNGEVTSAPFPKIPIGDVWLELVFIPAELRDETGYKCLKIGEIEKKIEKFNSLCASFGVSLVLDHTLTTSTGYGALMLTTVGRMPCTINVEGIQLTPSAPFGLRNYCLPYAVRWSEV